MGRFDTPILCTVAAGVGGASLGCCHMVVAGFVGTGLSRVPSAKARLSHARCWLLLMPAGSRAVVKATGNALSIAIH